MESFVIPGTCLGFKDEKTLDGDFTFVHCGKIFSTVVGRVKRSSEADSRIKISVLPIRRASPTPDIGSIVIAKVSSITHRFARCDIVAVEDRPLAGKFRGMILREDIRATQRDRAEPSLSFRPGDLVRARIINIIGSSSGTYASTCLPDPSACSPEVGAIVLAARAVAGSVQPSPSHAISGSNAATTTYLLSTAEADLGVVLGLGRPSFSGTTEVLGATSGCPLLPVSWTEMICPRTLTRFPRKVARIPDDLLKILVCSSHEDMASSV